MLLAKRDRSLPIKILTATSRSMFRCMMQTVRADESRTQWAFKVNTISAIYNKDDHEQHSCSGLCTTRK